LEKKNEGGGGSDQTSQEEEGRKATLTVGKRKREGEGKVRSDKGGGPLSKGTGGKGVVEKVGGYD